MNWTLRRKTLLGYSIVLLLIVLVLAWAIVNLLRLGRASEAILSENYRSILAAEHMIDALERQDSGVLLYILGFEEEGISQFRENQNTFSRWLARAEDNVTIPGEEQLIGTIDTTYTTYLLAFTRLVRQSGGDDDASLRTQYYEGILPVFSAVREAGTRLRDLNERTMERASDRASEISHTAIWSMSLVGALALVAGFVFSLLLSNRLIRPIRGMSEAAAHIARGDYDVEVPPGPSDELGRLAEQFNEMASRLRAFREMNVERLRAEKHKSDAIIQSIDDGLVLIGSDLDVESMNPAAADALATDPEAAIGRHFLEIVQDDRLFRYVEETVASGQAPMLDEDELFFSVGRGQHARHYQVVVTPVHSPRHTLAGAILLLRDVTKLKELDRLKSEFVATASHELKTPLTSIEMSIGLLQERARQKLDANEQELLSVAEEDVNRLRLLVNDLLDLSKIEAGQINLDYADVPVTLLFDKTIQTMARQAEERDVELVCEVPGDLPDVRADANKITWILTNLVSNALRYTESGGRVAFTAEVAGSRMHLSVADNGRGIPYEYQSKIFDKFVQVEDEKATKGSGLGLAICKEIVRAHGGSIWVDSMPGIGSTFTFTLPLASSRPS